MSRWRAVVFDLDDTLYPERAYVRGGFEAVARWASETMGEEPQAVMDELWAMFESGVRGDTFDHWLRGRGRAPETDRAAMIDAYRRHRPRLAAYPDVIPALEGLRGKVRLGLITEGSREVQDAKLDALGLRSWFNKVVVLGEEQRADWKPSPRPFQQWLEGSSIEPAAAIYLGDNPAKDFLGARHAGWTSVRVRRSDGLHREEEPEAAEAHPDLEISTLQSLPSILEHLEAAPR
jgi:putative hydrolase of the HAD superfamily